MSQDATRVVLIEDHTLLAQSMIVALSVEGFAVTAVQVPPTPGGLPGLQEQIVGCRPQVVLLDLDLGPSGDGAPLINTLHHTGCAVVVVTGGTDRARWGECLARGARTVLPKSAPLGQIADTLRRVTTGQPVMDPGRREELIRRWQDHRRQGQSLQSRLDRLTPRESEVLSALACGKRVREISLEFFVSEATVRSQVKSILAKLRVTSQIAAVAMLRDTGWTPAP